MPINPGQPRPIVALLTDFGTRDHYVGTMKGVVLGVCPDVALVDITHEIPPQDLLAGALELAAAYRYFPAGTVFLVVVDPGVGSGRRALAAEAGGYRFVAPDNGVLTAVLRESSPRMVVELSNPKYQRPAVSRTFEGRDRFAPAAGWLAAGMPVESFGPVLPEYVKLTIPAPVLDADRATGVVLRIDRFGNLITNLHRSVVEPLMAGGPVEVRIAGRVVAHVVSTYAEAPAGTPCALFGSTDHLEIAVPQGDAAARLGIGRGAEVLVRRR
jgi:S-adenosylmethionine hydrolase